MNLEINKMLGNISAGVSRMEGLYAKLAQKHGFPYGVVQVLHILSLKDFVTQKQISEICEIPKQTVNRVIHQLKKENYIVLVASEEDKREKVIQLTPEGESCLQQVLQPFFTVNEKAAERVGIEVLQRLATELEMLGDAIELEMELQAVSSKWEKKKCISCQDKSTGD